jgi:lipopolysaccharide biosynthesis protein
LALFPQFHEFEVNSALWGKGYTDFVGVRATTASSPRDQIPHYPVIRPRDGFYDLTARWVRERHARQAVAAGIHGFIYYHYWFKGGPVMEKPLELLLKDGEPNLPFAISWANENWSKRWDGGDNAVLMQQTYAEQDWRPHFDWLARFFAHPAYIRRQGKPILFLYRVHDVPQLGKMLAHWQRWAIEAGLGGLYIVQTNGIRWTPTA